jgi:DNA repair photolyase
MELKQMIKGLAQAGIQNGLGMSPMIKALREDSITAMARTLDDAEEEFYRRQSEASQKQSETEQMKLQVQLEENQKQRDLEYYKIDTEAQLRREEMANNQSEVMPEDNSIEYSKLNLAERKQALEEQKLATTTNTDLNKFNKDLNLKKEQLNEQVRHNKEAEKISRIKKPTSTKK